jgi:hypothetical protein
MVEQKAQIANANAACVLGIPVWVLDILVAAQAQTQLATWDTAVNSSRHLKDEDVAAILMWRRWGA